MKRLRIVLIDDEPPARRKMRRLLERTPDTEIAGEAGSGVEAIALIARERPDLVFLDIQMPDMDGFEVLQGVNRPAAMQVVFVTAFDQHALKAFEVHALDYLLKPVSPARFLQSLERARQRAGDSDTRLDLLLQQLGARKTYSRRILLNTGQRALFVSADDIDFAESARNYVVVHVQGQSHQIRSSLEAFAEQLDPEQFARINRSQIINLGRVREARPWFHGDYRAILRNGMELNWSRRYSPKSRLSRVQSQ